VIACICLLGLVSVVASGWLAIAARKSWLRVQVLELLLLLLFTSVLLLCVPWIEYLAPNLYVHDQAMVETRVC
jgi:hypothetical protein